MPGRLQHNGVGVIFLHWDENSDGSLVKSRQRETRQRPPQTPPPPFSFIFTAGWNVFRVWRHCQVSENRKKARLKVRDSSISWKYELLYIDWRHRRGFDSASAQQGSFRNESCRLEFRQVSVGKAICVTAVSWDECDMAQHVNFLCGALGFSQTQSCLSLCHIR